jgi:hypothetical protein
MSPKDYSYVQPVIKEAILLKEQKEPKMAKDEAKKRRDIESKRATRWPKQKIAKKNDSEKRQKSPNTWIFFVFRKNCYICPFV